VERIKVGPAWLYQRYRVFFDRLVPALGIAWLFVLTNRATGTFPGEWLGFIAGSILVAGLAAPLAGYVLFVLALAYPLYSISIYVAALALAVLIVLSFFVTRHFAAIVLVLTAPLLSVCRVAPLVPLLAGLWWAEWGGVLVGMGSALWLKTFAGMCGATPDLVQLGGQALAVQQLVDRFHVANSLQTLLQLADPLAPDPQALLLHILEILGWGLAGYGVGIVGRRIESVRRPAISLLASISAGMLGLWFGSIVIPVALGLREASDSPISVLLGFLVQSISSGVLVLGLYAGARYLVRPVVLPTRSRSDPYRPSTTPEPASQPWSRPQPVANEDEPTDIIMIDLD
jgi:hypothetical protein